VILDTSAYIVAVPFARRLPEKKKTRKPKTFLGLVPKRRKSPTKKAG